MLVWIWSSWEGIGRGNTWVLGHELSGLHASSHFVEVPDLVQGAAGAADDGCCAAGGGQGGEDGAGGVGLGGGGENVGCGEELVVFVSFEVGIGLGGWERTA